MKCTWEGCKKKAVMDHKAKDGSTWARTCNEHQIKLEENIKNGNGKGLFGVWIKMHGGSKKFAKEMTDKMFKDPKFQKLVNLITRR